MEPVSSQPMNAILTAIVTWLAANFGLPPSHDHPNVVFWPAERVAELRYGRVSSSRRRDVVAVYDDAKKTIFLPDNWTGKTAVNVSILVHEMVHHLQNVAGLQYECPALREKVAYAAQEAWLHLFGRSLFQEFEIDRMTLKLTTECIRS